MAEFEDEVANMSELDIPYGGTLSFEQRHYVQCTTGVMPFVRFCHFCIASMALATLTG